MGIRRRYSAIPDERRNLCRSHIEAPTRGNGHRKMTLRRQSMNFPKISSLRLSLRLITIYAIVCLFWVGFVDWVAPNIIAAAYDDRDLPILNWVFRDRSLPVEHYIDRWN